MVVNTGTVGTLEGLSACRHLYEGLYKIDATGKPVLGQAKDVKVSEDGLTYTFTLRDDISWSDGQPVRRETSCMAGSISKPVQMTTAIC